MKESKDRTRTSQLITIVKMIWRWIILIYCEFYKPKSQVINVKIDISLWVACYRRNMVYPIYSIIQYNQLWLVIAYTIVKYCCFSYTCECLNRSLQWLTVTLLIPVAARHQEALHKITWLFLWSFWKVTTMMIISSSRIQNLFKWICDYIVIQECLYSYHIGVCSSH